VSALYEGRVGHRRLRPVEHRFSYRVVMAYLDLEAVPETVGPRWLWSARRPALVRFRAEDHMSADDARSLVAQRTGARPDGPVRLLTNLRCFGHLFNPVSFYYCFDGDERLLAVVARVTNTPWREQHDYVLTASDDDAIHERVDKAFHVSPFMAMDHEYELWLTAPDGELDVRIVSRREGEVQFDAGLALRRRPLHARALAGALARQPVPTLAVIGRIYANAFRLKMKGAPYHPHPAR
jgi:uncharacterized protein